MFPDRRTKHIRMAVITEDDRTYYCIDKMLLLMTVFSGRLVQHSVSNYRQLIAALKRACRNREIPIIPSDRLSTERSGWPEGL